jgi:hypothetical protein
MEWKTKHTPEEQAEIASRRAAGEIIVVSYHADGSVSRIGAARSVEEKLAPDWKPGTFDLLLDNGKRLMGDEVHLDLAAPGWRKLLQVGASIHNSPPID